MYFHDFHCALGGVKWIALIHDSTTLQQNWNTAIWFEVKYLIGMDSSKTHFGIWTLSQSEWPSNLHTSMKRPIRGRVELPEKYETSRFDVNYSLCPLNTLLSPHRCLITSHLIEVWVGCQGASDMWWRHQRTASLTYEAKGEHWPSDIFRSHDINFNVPMLNGKVKQWTLE